MENSSLDKNYWNNRYQIGQIAWDVGNISTPLKEYIDQWKDKDAAVLIPGCGNAYEADYLLTMGFSNITLIDIAPAAVEALNLKFEVYLGKQLRVICGDFFELQDKFDLILEQTFFCALDPALRKSYVHKMSELLKPAGKLTGVLFNRNFEGGPPFGGSKAEYEQLFADVFQVEVMEECRSSIAPRAGSELFFIVKKRS